MTDAEIFDKVKEILVDQFDLEEDEVSLTTDLTTSWPLLKTSRQPKTWLTRLKNNWQLNVTGDHA